MAQPRSRPAPVLSRFPQLAISAAASTAAAPAAGAGASSASVDKAGPAAGTHARFRGAHTPRVPDAAPQPFLPSGTAGWKRTGTSTGTGHRITPPASPRAAGVRTTSSTSPPTSPRAPSGAAPTSPRASADLPLPDDAPPTRVRGDYLKEVPDQLPPLLVAVGTGDVHLVEAELSKRGDAALDRSDLGWTALHAAARARAPDAVVALLLAAHVPIDTVDRSGDSAIHVAAHYNAVSVLAMLVGAGATPARRNQQGRTPLQEALMVEATDTFAWLLGRSSAQGAAARPGGEDVNAVSPQWWRTTLILAISESVPVERFIVPLLRAGADPRQGTDTNQTALHYAILCDHVAAVSALLTHAPELVNEPLRATWARTALNLAVAEHRSVALVRALLDAGADALALDDHGYSPLELAIIHDGDEGRLVQTLLAHPASRDRLVNRASSSWWRTPAHLAVRRDRPQHLRLLAQAGALLTAEDAQGRTPLVLALVETSRNALAVLLELLGTRINHCTTQSWRGPLHAAVAYGTVALVPQLLDCGGLDLTIKDAADRTALEFAVAMNAADVVKAMVPKHASVRALSSQPWRSLLHVAVMYKQPEMLKLLLGLGADLHQTNAAGNTALQLAQRLDLLECIDVLLDHEEAAVAPTDAPRTSRDRPRTSFERARSSFERARSSFERVRTSFEAGKRSVFER